MIYVQLFISFLQIGAFSFGGGYAAMPLIQEQVVTMQGWLTKGEFTDLVTISQMTPGPIAINAATFVGNKMAGIPGSMIATFGCVLPSCIFVTIITWLYMRYRNLTLMQDILSSLRPVVVAMIAGAGLSILLTAFFQNGMPTFTKDNIQSFSIFLFLAAMYLLRKKQWNPIAVMVFCGILEMLKGLLL